MEPKFSQWHLHMLPGQCSRLQPKRTGLYVGTLSTSVSTTAKFLEPVHVQLQERLEEDYILFDQNDVLSRPRSLDFIPQCYTFNEPPITSSSTNSPHHLSMKYAAEDEKYLKILGVTTMTPCSFIFELELMIKTSPKGFSAKDADWHSHVAGVLYRLPDYLQSQLRQLPIIPLSDGTCVAEDSGSMILSSSTSEFDIPDGLQLAVVDAQAAVQSVMVTCKDGRTERLDSTFLSKKELLVADQEGVPFLDLLNS